MVVGDVVVVVGVAVVVGVVVVDDVALTHPARSANLAEQSVRRSINVRPTTDRVISEVVIETRGTEDCCCGVVLSIKEHTNK